MDSEQNIMNETVLHRNTASEELLPTIHRKSIEIGTPLHETEKKHTHQVQTASQCGVGSIKGLSELEERILKLISTQTSAEEKLLSLELATKALDKSIENLTKSSSEAISASDPIMRKIINIERRKNSLNKKIEIAKEYMKKQQYEISNVKKTLHFVI